MLRGTGRAVLFTNCLDDRVNPNLIPTRDMIQTQSKTNTKPEVKTIKCEVELLENNAIEIAVGNHIFWLDIFMMIITLKL